MAATLDIDRLSRAPLNCGSGRFLLTVWQKHVEHEQQRIEKAGRAYANTEIIDREGYFAKPPMLRDKARLSSHALRMD